MSSKNNSENIPKIPAQKATAPIPINVNRAQYNRQRSASVSSLSSSSTSSASELATPVSSSEDPRRVNIPSPGTSPMLAFFLAQSPTTKAPLNSTFPFKGRFGTAPVFEEDERDTEPPAATHARRASTTVGGGFAKPQGVPLPSQQRGASVLRRLSLSSGPFARPTYDNQSGSSQSPPGPPNTAVSPTARTLPFARGDKRRSATLSPDGSRPRRAPSPMGERILKGHFDGFN